MELMITASTDTLDELLKRDIAGVILGLRPLSQRMEATYDLDAVRTMTAKAKNSGKKVWLNLNVLLHEDDLTTMERTIETIAAFDVDGILFADLSIYHAAERAGMKDRLIYYPETYVTCAPDVAFWAKEAIKTAILSRELTLEDIRAIGEKKTMPISIIGHGYLNMFHSKRELIKTFFDYTQDAIDAEIRGKSFRLVEEIREEPYPVYQDEFGTHIFRHKPLASFQVYDTLGQTVDYFIINTQFYDKARILSIVDDYIALEAGRPVDMKKYDDHDDGFHHKKTDTVQKKGDVR